jgi:hypothetical protein
MPPLGQMPSECYRLRCGSSVMVLAPKMSPESLNPAFSRRGEKLGLMPVGFIVPSTLPDSLTFSGGQEQFIVFRSIRGKSRFQCDYELHEVGHAASTTLGLDIAQQRGGQ